jgi:hypothetical protein
VALKQRFAGYLELVGSSSMLVRVHGKFWLDNWTVSRACGDSVGSV